MPFRKKNLTSTWSLIFISFIRWVKKIALSFFDLPLYFTRNYIFYMYVTGSSLFSPIHRSLIRDIKREITFLLCLVIALIAAITGSIHRFFYFDSVDVITKASTNKTATCSHVPTVYNRTPISRTRITRTKSNVPWMSSHFSVIDKKFTEIYADSSNSGSCNSTRMLSHLVLLVVLYLLTLVNTTAIWF